MRLLRTSPAYTRLLVAHTISPLGDAMATTALILHLQETTGTATSVGILLFAEAVPPLATPLAGAVADRVHPGRLLAAGFLAQAAVMGVLAVWLPSLAGIVALVFLRSLFETPLAPAVGRAIPAVVADADLATANALRGGVRELGTVIGPPLAGVLFVASGARLVLAVDAVTFVLAIPLVLGLPRLKPVDGPTGETVRRSLVADARDGLVLLWRSPVTRAVALGFWVVVLFSATDDLILAFLAADTFGGGPVAVGVLLAAASVGLLLGLPAVGPVARRLRVTTAIVVGFGVMSAANLATAAAPGLAAAVVAQIARGSAIPLADTFVTTHVQRTTPPAFLGRVLANVYGGVGVAAAAGYLLGGPVLDATSPRLTFVFVGAGGLLGTALTALLVRRAAHRDAFTPS